LAVRLALSSTCALAVQRADVLSFVEDDDAFVAELARRGGPFAEEYARIGEAMMGCGTSLEFACACCAETGDRQKRLCSAERLPGSALPDVQLAPIAAARR